MPDTSMSALFDIIKLLKQIQIIYFTWWGFNRELCGVWRSIYSALDHDPAGLCALTFTFSGMFQRVVLMVIRLIFHCLYTHTFSSSPRVAIIPPHKHCSRGLSVEPSQEHKSSFIAFYRLLHHSKCRVECTEMVTVSFLFPTCSSPTGCLISPPAGWSV